MVGGAVAGDVGSVTTQGRSGTNVSTVQPSSIGVANGVDSTATGTGANAGTIIGVNGATATVKANGATAYGAQSLAQDTNTTAIGFRATAKQAGSLAVGYNASALADPSTAVGADSMVTATADNGVAVGASSLVSGANSVALGFNAQATSTNAVALGTNSVANQANTVSVGSVGNERRITNVAPGIAGTDAANVNQLNSVSNQVNNVTNQLNDVSKIAYSGTALSLAMSGTYMPTLAGGESAVGVGLGNYKGYTAVALTFKSLNQEGNMSWGGGIATSGRNVGVNMGIGWKW
jgi:autotransporter adhesin